MEKDLMLAEEIRTLFRRRGLRSDYPYRHSGNGEPPGQCVTQDGDPVCECGNTGVYDRGITVRTDGGRDCRLSQRAQREIPHDGQKCYGRRLPEGDGNGSVNWIFIFAGTSGTVPAVSEDGNC